MIEMLAVRLGWLLGEVEKRAARVPSGKPADQLAGSLKFVLMLFQLVGVNCANADGANETARAAARSREGRLVFIIVVGLNVES